MRPKRPPGRARRTQQTQTRSGILIRILDRIPYFDDRSRHHGISTLLTTDPFLKREKIWQTGPSLLDQGTNSGCVGFGLAHELSALTTTRPADNDVARMIYAAARAEDRAMGNHWPAGASLLAGAKALKQLNLITEYRWAFGITQVLKTLITHGPIVLGIPWSSHMYDTEPGGLVDITGRPVGGHAIMAHGYIPAHATFGEVIVWTNSWGPSYGINGRAYVRVNDLARLLARHGEACIPIVAPTVC